MLLLDKESETKVQFFLSKSFISDTYSWDILQFDFKKSLDFDLKNLGLPY